MIRRNTKYLIRRHAKCLLQRRAKCLFERNTEMLTAVQPSMTFLTIYVARWFITLFTRARYWFLTQPYKSSLFLTNNTFHFNITNFLSSIHPNSGSFFLQNKGVYCWVTDCVVRTLGTLRWLKPRCFCYICSVFIMQINVDYNINIIPQSTMVTLCICRFNTHKFYVLPTQRIYMFPVDLRKTAIISLYSINWLVFITETECVYCAVRTGSLYIILRSAHTVYLCVFCGSENKQRLFPYTALTDWFL